jgi:hypothetical protein
MFGDVGPTRGSQWSCNAMVRGLPAIRKAIHAIQEKYFSLVKIRVIISIMRILVGFTATVIGTQQFQGAL